MTRIDSPNDTIETWLRLVDGLSDEATENALSHIATAAADVSYGAQISTDAAAHQGLNSGFVASQSR